MARYSTDYECKILSEFAARATKGIVEIGVLDGETTRQMAKSTKAWIYGIDPLIPDSMNAGLIGNERVIRENMQDCKRFSFIKDYSYNVASWWKFPIDMVFIDGDHRHDAVERDIRDWYNLLTEGGVMLIHDSAPVTSEKATFAGHEGVIKAVKETIEAGRKCIGVWDTITGFIKL